MRTHKDSVLLQTTVHKDVHKWLAAFAVQEGTSVASLVRRWIHKHYVGAPDLPALPAKPKRATKPKATRQLALPGTERGKRARKAKPRRTKTQRRKLKHLEPEAAQ